MTIDWNNFTPLASLIGGLIIGMAVAIFALCVGRIAGVSGILGGLLRPGFGELGWRIAFVLGMSASPLLYRMFATLPAVHIDAGWPILVVSGLLVGLGTRYGSGCTSGHGVCGLSNLSLRSLVATLVFMGAGVVTVYVMRHLLGA